MRGILTTKEAQLIFVDTPGIHKPHHQLGKVLVQNALRAINAVDIILFVVDSSVKLGKGDTFIVQLLQQTKNPIILGLNKSDLQPTNPGELDESYAKIAEEQGWSFVKFSASTKQGLNNLHVKLISQLDSGPYYYSPDLITDQPERFIMGELIREQILLHTRQEIPHSVAITIEKIEEVKSITRIIAAINVERDSQKGILIGKGGKMLKTIGTSARQEMEKLIVGKVYLKLFVKVTPKWLQSPQILVELGYSLEN
ncbi:MAG: GTPase Era [Prochloron sp. SP5CPC1]|nr:GTPase Era [Candidatus Paraprochloron terpiosi SP5CPC1]